MFRYLTVFISFILLLNTAYAASRVALVIGNANYQKISPLNNTLNDADDMEQALRELDFEVIKVINGTRREMLKAVNEFRYQLHGGQVGLFYFSGHGIQKDGRNYLIPVKANIHTAYDLEFEAVDMKRVLANIKQAGNELNIIILDACRDNPFEKLWELNKSWGERKRGLARIDAIPSSIVAYATQPGNVAIERPGERNGIYTKHLLRLIKRPGLSLPDLFNEVGRAVLDDTGDQQQPWVHFSPLPKFCLAGDCSPRQHIDIVKPPVKNIINTTPAFPEFQDYLRDGRLGPKMVWIPAGSFLMGDSQGDGDFDEQPAHWATVSRFALGKYEVTFAEYDRFAEATYRNKPNDKGWGRGNRPVINISWNDATAYAQWLSQQTGQHYRLPTEAEWEYAVRAGLKTKFSWGDMASHEYANYGKDGCCGGLAIGKDRWKYTAPVGYFDPNPFGLYDMVGNVWEWTCSEYEERYNGKEEYCMSKHRANSSNVVMRGGSWACYASWMRPANRNRNRPSSSGHGVGMRLARE